MLLETLVFMKYLHKITKMDEESCNLNMMPKRVKSFDSYIYIFSYVNVHTTN